MPNDSIERLLNEIGQLLAEDTEYPLDGTLLYAVLDTNYVAPSVFKDRGHEILYREPDLDRLGGALLDLWNATDPAHRWTEIEYVIRDGKFHVSFTYPEDVGPEDEDEHGNYKPFARRSSIVARHFGDKPIVYPPMPDDMNTFNL